MAAEGAGDESPFSRGMQCSGYSLAPVAHKASSRDSSAASTRATGDDASDDAGASVATDAPSSAAGEVASITRDAPPPSRRCKRGLWLAEATERTFYAAAQRRYDGVVAPTITDDGAGGTPTVGTGNKLDMPRLIHHIWLGSRLPSKFQRLRETWVALHPESDGWRCLLWTDAEVAKLTLFNQTAFDAAANYGEKSDILRYELLHALGGVYIDVDVQCVRSLSDALRPEARTTSATAPSTAAGSETEAASTPTAAAATRTRVGFIAGFSNTGTLELNNAVIGCRAGHPLMRRLVLGIVPDSAAFAAAAVSTPATGAAAGTGPMAQLHALLPELAVVMSPADAKHKATLSTIRRTGPGYVTRTVQSFLATAGTVGGASDARTSDSFDAWSAEHASQWRQFAFTDGAGPAPVPAPSSAPVSSSIDASITDAAADVLLVPASVFYPLPNDARYATPPLACGDDALAAWRAVACEHSTEATGASARDDARAALDAATRVAVGADVAAVLQSSTVAVHYWAQSWQ